MARRKARVWLALACAVTLAACKVDGRFQVFVEEIDGLLSGAPNTGIGASITTDMSSERECREALNRAASVLRRHFMNLSDVECQSERLVFYATVPLYADYNYSAEGVPFGSVIGFGVQRMRDGGAAVVAYLNRTRLNALNRDLENAFDHEADFDFGSIVFDVETQGARDAQISAPSVYFNDEPRQDLSAPVGDGATLRMSDVTIDTLNRYSSALMFEVR